MKIEIVGPNLVDQSKGSFHVHAAGCADLNKRQYHSNRNIEQYLWIIEAESQQEIVEEVYSDFLPTNDDGEPTTWLDYADDVYIFPCVKLPEEVRQCPPSYSGGIEDSVIAPLRKQPLNTATNSRIRCSSIFLSMP